MPATFAGTLPCADCQGIRYRVDLFANGTFFSRTAYEGRNAGFDDIGRWQVSDDGKTLVLRGAREAPESFAIVGPGRLRTLAGGGQEIAPGLNDLTRQAHFTPIEPRLTMSGLYQYMADTGLFTECSTGVRWPVASEKDNAAIQTAYGKVRTEPNQQILASIDGQIALRPRMEGDGKQFTVIVQKFISFRPGRGCGSPSPDVMLENTHWVLTQLGDRAITPGDYQTEPYIVLQSEDHRISGSGGCNRLLGGYTLSGDALSFGQVASTMMFCSKGMETEQGFIKALEAVRSWEMTAQHLELYDASGGLMARFEAQRPH